MSVLMGANIANEVADEKFCETTIGEHGNKAVYSQFKHFSHFLRVALSFPLFVCCKNKNHGTLLKELMQTNNFRVTVVEEYDVVEICGALKSLQVCLQLFISSCGVCLLPLLCCAEHCCSGRRFLRRSGLRGQHEGSGDQAGPDGDDCFRKDFLQSWARFLGDLPGELRCGRPHHNMLRRPQPQSS
ncbi:hypothetical protein XENOCAPTIV_001870 [Xenoophorus captivus]|uniref:Uncharacterized protein n=1 Tax=Xenoophorus captivus TaxID=1517983 RepID=A0ABV0QFX2_9TELE